MSERKKEFKDQFEGKVRVRVCGLCFNGDDRLLMIKHSNVGSRKILWSPPGGGLKFDETSEDALVREFKEETNLDIEPVNFLFVNEVISNTLHAVELFYLVRLRGGQLEKGTDPELNHQLIEDVEWLDFKQLKEIPKNSKHNIFHNINSNQELLNLRGKMEYRF